MVSAVSDHFTLVEFCDSVTQKTTKFLLGCRMLEIPCFLRWSTSMDGKIKRSSKWSVKWKFDNASQAHHNARAIPEHFAEKESHFLFWYLWHDGFWLVTLSSFILRLMDGVALQKKSAAIIETPKSVGTWAQSWSQTVTVTLEPWICQMQNSEIEANNSLSFLRSSVHARRKILLLVCWAKILDMLQ